MTQGMAVDKVTLSVSLRMSEPYNISLSKPDRAESLKLIATVKQESSPFPDRAVTLRTTNTVLDNSKNDNAFWRRLIGAPTDVNDDKFKIYMHPGAFGIKRNPCRMPGKRDLRQRKNDQFITVPPLGQGTIDVAWSFAPRFLLCFYQKWRSNTSIEERLKRFTVGQRFRVTVRTRSWPPIWWTWGSLQHDLNDKKFSRWSLPDGLPLIREAGQDEEDEIDRGLVNIVDSRLTLASTVEKWHELGRPDIIDEKITYAEKPFTVKEMTSQGWVFGEPSRSLKIVCEQTVTFDFVE